MFRLVVADAQTDALGRERRHFLGVDRRHGHVAGLSRGQDMRGGRTGERLRHTFMTQRLSVAIMLCVYVRYDTTTRELNIDSCF